MCNNQRFIRGIVKPICGPPLFFSKLYLPGPGKSVLWSILRVSERPAIVILTTGERGLHYRSLEIPL